MSDELPLGYLLTWTCYGTRLHGDQRGSVDSAHNQPGRPFLAPNQAFVNSDRRQLKWPPFSLPATARQVVASTIIEVCDNRGWNLEAYAVRTAHAHVVLLAQGEPEPILASLKAWCTRRLRESGIADPPRKLWTHHGSTGYLWRRDDVQSACVYVVEGQGGTLYPC